MCASDWVWLKAKFNSEVPVNMAFGQRVRCWGRNPGAMSQATVNLAVGQRSNSDFRATGPAGATQAAILIAREIGAVNVMSQLPRFPSPTVVGRNVKWLKFVQPTSIWKLSNCRRNMRPMRSRPLPIDQRHVLLRAKCRRHFGRDCSMVDVTPLKPTR